MNGGQFEPPPTQLEQLRPDAELLASAPSPPGESPPSPNLLPLHIRPEVLTEAVAKGVKKAFMELIASGHLSPSSLDQTPRGLEVPNTSPRPTAPTPSGSWRSSGRTGCADGIPVTRVLSGQRRSAADVSDAIEPLTAVMQEFAGQARALSEMVRRASNSERRARRSMDGSGSDEDLQSGNTSPSRNSPHHSLRGGTTVRGSGANWSRAVSAVTAPKIAGLTDRVIDSLPDPLQHHMWGEMHENNRIPHSKHTWRMWYQKLETVSSDSRLWCRLIHAKPAAGDAAGVINDQFVWGEAAVDASAVDPPENPVSTLESGEIDIAGDFDLTPQRVEQIFHRADLRGLKQGTGLLTLGQFGQALRSQGLRLDPALKSIMKAVDMSGDGKVTLPGFEVALRMLKLGALFEFHDTPNGEIDVTDFSQDKDKTDVQSPVEDLTAFFFGHRAKNANRWIHVHGADQELLLRLTVKYHLHPLGVQDAWELIERSSENRKTKVDRYGSHYVVLLCVYSLAEDWDEVFGPDDSYSVPARVDVRQSQMIIFLAGAPNWDTLISIPEQAEPTSLASPRAGRRESDASNGSGFRGFGRAAWTRTNTAGVLPLTGVWAEIRTLLQKRTRAREARCDFLMHEVLSYAVDELKPIVIAYKRRLERFQKRLGLLESSFEQSSLNDVSNMNLEMTSFVRQAIRPLRHAIRRFLDDATLAPDAITYLTESLEKLEVLADDVAQLMEMCKTIPEDFKAHSDKKLNNTLFALTLATVLFMPAQLLAGVYGMNFVDDQGNPGIPELRWKHGYAYFWVTVIGLVTLLGGCAWLQLRDKKLPEEPKPHLAKGDAVVRITDAGTPGGTYSSEPAGARDESTPAYSGPPRLSVSSIPGGPGSSGGGTKQRRSRRRSTVSFARPAMPGAPSAGS